MILYLLFWIWFIGIFGSIAYQLKINQSNLSADERTPFVIMPIIGICWPITLPVQMYSMWRLKKLYEKDPS